MSAVFDIQPPPQKTTKNKNISKNKKVTKINKGSSVFVFIIVILFSILLFSFFSNSQVQSDILTNKHDNNTEKEIDNLGTVETKSLSEKLTDNSKTTESSSSPQATFSQESVDDTNQQIAVIVLNGAQKTGVANLAKNKLEENGIKVASIGNAKNIYSHTVIYYTNENKILAEKIQETLANYNPKLEVNDELSNNKKITIVIGKS